MLVGRDGEREAIGRALAAARSGESSVLALTGDPGIGKTALLDHAADVAVRMRVLRARGIESEAQIPFGSLLELLRPALALVERLPPPQAAALESALAMRPGPAQERFAVGAATLGLLAALAEEQPVAVLVDDAQWLDHSSAQALLFAARRLVADPIAVVLAVRAGAPSLLDGADLPVLPVTGLTPAATAELLDGVAPAAVARLHLATGGNPLALLELRDRADEPAPAGAPVLVSARIAQAYTARMEGLGDATRAALVLAATSDSRDPALLERAAAALGVDLGALAAAERRGLVALGDGAVAFPHPLARSAVYAAAPPEQRRAAHRALAGALPDRDHDRRAWHLAAAAAGTDEAAAAALEHAGERARRRSAYGDAAAAFERGARLTANGEHRARLLRDAAETAWLAGLAERAVGLLAEARAATADAALRVRIDRLAGEIAVRRGPVMRGHAMLLATAALAEPDAAVAMLADAGCACLYAGEAVEMLATAERAAALAETGVSSRSRFLAGASLGMAQVLGGDAAAGTRSIHAAIALAEEDPALRDDPELLPWLAIGPIFLREAGGGRPLLAHALDAARGRAAVGALPRVLNLIARDEATTDRWARADATYREAIDLARESGQQTELAFGVAGLAWLLARRGHADECRAHAAEAAELSRALGARLPLLWATNALAELELASGAPEHAAERLRGLQSLLHDFAITDVDLSPVPELVDALLRSRRPEEAVAPVAALLAASEAKGQPWSLARALRASGLVEDDFEPRFERALALHARTPDSFEAARTRLAYGERLRRVRERRRAREQLRAALEVFERLDAAPWAERARTELEATGETLRRRDPSAMEALTPQEVRIAHLLAAGRTTREAAAALFLSPKTVEFHLRSVYRKLDIHSRAELAGAVADGHAAG